MSIHKSKIRSFYIHGCQYITVKYVILEPNNSWFKYAVPYRIWQNTLNCFYHFITLGFLLKFVQFQTDQYVLIKKNMIKFDYKQVTTSLHYN